MEITDDFLTDLAAGAPGLIARAAACVLAALRAIVAGVRGRRLDEAVLVAVCWRIDGLRGRLLSLHERFKAGKVPARRPARARVAPGPAKPRRRGLATLARLAPREESPAEFPLDPELVALIEAAPEAAGRILRPLCELLGVAVPERLKLAKRVRRRSARGGGGGLPSAAHPTDVARAERIVGNARAVATPHPPAARAGPPGSSPGGKPAVGGEGKNFQKMEFYGVGFV